MNFGKRTGPAEAARILARAAERGIRLLDTANAYNDGESERIVGRAIAARREALLVATKVGLGRRAGKAEGLSRAAIHSGIEGSLSRLRTDYVDIYYLHAPDPATPLAETDRRVRGARGEGTRAAASASPTLLPGKSSR